MDNRFKRLCVRGIVNGYERTGKIEVGEKE
jgi:hypothetical protein